MTVLSVCHLGLCDARLDLQLVQLLGKVRFKVTLQMLLLTDELFAVHVKEKINIQVQRVLFVGWVALQRGDNLPNSLVPLLKMFVVHPGEELALDA